MPGPSGARKITASRRIALPVPPCLPACARFNCQYVSCRKEILIFLLGRGPFVRCSLSQQSNKSSLIISFSAAFSVSSHFKMGSMPQHSILKGPARSLFCEGEPVQLHKIFEHVVGELEKINNDNNNTGKYETIHGVSTPTTFWVPSSLSPPWSAWNWRDQLF